MYNDFISDIEEISTNKNVIVKDVEVKTILGKSGIQDNFCINPYTGCTHSCGYCYAKFMTKFSGRNENATTWGTFVDCKQNSVVLLKKLKKEYWRKKFRNSEKKIIIGTVTDAYQPIEKEKGITRMILKELLNDYRESAKLQIITKSKLIVRDVDLLKKFKSITVAISLCFVDEEKKKIIEPHSSSVKERLETIKILHKNGIHVQLFLMPIFPFITEWKKVIEMTKDYVDLYNFDRLNFYKNLNTDIYNFVSKVDPKLINTYEQMYFGFDKKKLEDYWKKTGDEIEKYCEDNNLDFIMFFRNARSIKKNKNLTKFKSTNRKRTRKITDYFSKKPKKRKIIVID